MKRPTAPITFIMVMSLFTLLLVSCKKDTETATTTPLTDSDKNALLFMLEEEKLARDTYTYLWEVSMLTLTNKILADQQGAPPRNR